MLEMVKGCQVPFPEKLGEGYKMEERMITANVGAGKLRQAVENFIAMHASERLFFILEIPTNQKGEPEPEKVLHKDVYYLDGCSRKKALGILEDYGELLIQDGVSAFGFGCQETGDEIMVEKYNILTLWSRRRLEKYRAFFEKLDIGEREELVTAWDTFEQQHPGRTRLYTLEGKSIYDLPEAMKSQGLYFAERREDR
ncbi:MAG: hypothetical protein HFF13_02270 [Angelakisella sp.]|nr:hypothetical protein [Angelakisella sp.]